MGIGDSEPQSVTNRCPMNGRRAGELLKEINGKGNNQHSGGTPTKLTQREAAEQAGLFKDQQVTAVRVANVPAEQFEKAVESDEPPTVTALAEMGKQSRPAPAAPSSPASEPLPPPEATLPASAAAPPVTAPAGFKQATYLTGVMRISRLSASRTTLSSSLAAS
jgi:hypothetical protein